MLFEDASTNAPALSVSEVAGAIRRVVEGEFGHVRVRGEVGRVTRHGSGHVYFDLKDAQACMAAVCWRTTAQTLRHRPEEGMEVIVTGRITTWAPGSKYQLIVESVEPAGLGALMAMLEQRRRTLAAEGLFDAARKRPIPYLPRVIGVVTSPTGAVIRDILHRLRDRFPSRVLLWPVAVQGPNCAAEVAAAVAGFNALGPGGRIPRPDLIIVARGGGSVEDLWGFNEEAVVRAVAAGNIPLISAVGHETDTTLIDHAADLRAPTPTAAAELAVPVRAELLARLAEHGARKLRAAQARTATPRQRLRDLARAMGRPQALTEARRQALDLTGARLEPGLRGFMRARRDGLAGLRATPALLRQRTREARGRLGQADPARALRRQAGLARERLERAGAPLERAAARPRQEAARRLAEQGRRLEAGLARARAEGLRRNAECRDKLAALGARLAAAEARQMRLRRERVDRLDRLRQTLGYRETLRRGFAVVLGPDGLVASAAAAAASPRLELEFHDGRTAVRPEGARPAPRRGPAGQGSLF